MIVIGWILSIGGYLAIGVVVARLVSRGEDGATYAEAMAFMLAWPIIIGVWIIALCVAALGWIAGGKAQI